EGTGRLRGGVEMAQKGASGARAGAGRAREAGADGVGRARLAVEDVGWFLREHLASPVEDWVDRLGTRAAIGIFGGGGVAVAGVVAALLIAGGGSGASTGRTEAFVVPQVSPTPAPKVAPATQPKKAATKPTGPTLHGAPPDFYPAQDVRSGVG